MYNLYLNQEIYVAGAFEGEISDTAWLATIDNNAQTHSTFLSNAKEIDTRTWLHIKTRRHTGIL